MIRSTFRVTSFTATLAPIAALFGLAATAAWAPAGVIGYADRSEVDLLVNGGAVVTHSTTGGLNEDRVLLHPTEDQTIRYWEPAAGHTGGWVQADFQQVRNVKTIQLAEFFGSYGLTAALVETSNDGVTWTPAANSVAGASTNRLITLTNAVDARYVRVTGQGGTDPTGRWIISQMGIYGDTGPLGGDLKLSVLSTGSAFAPAMDANTVGSITVLSGDGNTINGFFDQRPTVRDRTLIYNVGVGEGWRIDLGQAFTLDRFALVTSVENAHFDANANFLLEGSADGVTWVPLLDQNGGLLPGYNSYTFAPAAARHLRWTIDGGTTNTDLRFTEFQAFQVPEPTAVLAPLGAMLLAIRRRSR